MDEDCLVRPDGRPAAEIQAARKRDASMAPMRSRAYCRVLLSAEQQVQQVDSLADTTLTEVSASARRKMSVTTISTFRSIPLSLRSRPRSLSKIRIISLRR
jgi:hypothetical protein